MDREELLRFIEDIHVKYRFDPRLLEKDYHLSRVLNDVNAQLSDKIIFKGGTLLNKAYLNYHRLSEDLDFAYNGNVSTRAMRSKAMEPIREKMPDFLKSHGFTSENPRGAGFNNSTQVVFKAQYHSVISNQNEEIKIEVSLRDPLVKPPVVTSIKHIFQDPINNKDLFPQGQVLCLSYKEAVAEKLKAAISRRDPVIRDYYDLWHIDKTGFNFKDPEFVEIFKAKLEVEEYRSQYEKKFGLSEERIASLQGQIKTHLEPVIKAGETYSLNDTFKRYDKIFSDKRLRLEGVRGLDQGMGL